MEKVRLVPHEIILVSSIPPCNFCTDGTPGPYDFATYMGPWANGCERHWQQYAAISKLGTGYGQLWVTEDQVAWTERELVKRESEKARAGN